MKTTQFWNRFIDKKIESDNFMLNYTLSASVICVSQVKIAEDVSIVKNYNNAVGIKKNGVKDLHFDIMDGSFVPRYGIYPEIVKELKLYFPDFGFDFHLMTENPEFTIDQFAPYIHENNRISFHIDRNELNALRIIDKIKDLGAIPGLVLNMSTNVTNILRIVDAADVKSVMFMGIHPGVLKQISRPDLAIAGIQELQTYETGIETFQIDGGVNNKTAKQLFDAGFNYFICGTSTIFNKVNPLMSISEKRSLIFNNIRLFEDALQNEE
jgi:ribulose-phosphate 3-epimerase